MSEPKVNPMNDVAEVAAFRPVPRTGVIYVTVEAQKRGFDLDAPMGESSCVSCGECAAV